MTKVVDQMKAVNVQEKTNIDQILEKTKSTLDYKTILETVRKLSKDTIGDFKTVEDIQDRMNKSASFNKKIREETNKVLEMGTLDLQSKINKVLKDTRSF
jgi:hypothetical protein